MRVLHGCAIFAAYNGECQCKLYICVKFSLGRSVVFVHIWKLIVVCLSVWGALDSSGPD